MLLTLPRDRGSNAGTLKLATKYRKNVFGLYRFSLMYGYRLEQNVDALGPIFFETPTITLKIRTKYDITVKQRQLELIYGMRNPESGYDGNEENENGMVILRIVTIKYPVVWSV